MRRRPAVLHIQKRHTLVFKMSIATNLSISSSCNKSVKIRLVIACHLQTCYNLLKQLAASLWIKNFDDQLATSLLTICNKLVVNKLSQTMRTDLYISSLITRLLQDNNRLVATWAFLTLYDKTKLSLTADRETC